MPTPADRHRRLAKKAARQRKRRNRKHAGDADRTGPVRRQDSLRAAAAWPLHEVLVSKTWAKTAELAQVFVSRQGPQGRIAAAVFLLDLGCLGAKDGFGRIFTDASSYRALRSRVRSNMPMEKGDPALAAKIVREGIRYARELGFEPHPDVVKALPILNGIGNSTVEVPLGGEDGRPFYVQGPHDDVEMILSRLSQKRGSDGYDFTIRGEPRVARMEDDEGADPTGDDVWEHEGDDDEADARLLLDFAQPLLSSELSTASVKDVETRIRFAAAVWNAVVLDQLGGTRREFHDVCDKLLSGAGADRKSFLVIFERLRERKLHEYAEYIVHFMDVHVTEDPNGEIHIRLRAGRLIPDEED